VSTIIEEDDALLQVQPTVVEIASPPVVNEMKPVQIERNKILNHFFEYGFLIDIDFQFQLPMVL